jgi:UDPglucose 6-dehydrogenase
MREAPSTVLAARLHAEGATVRTWDPLARLDDDVEPWKSTTRHDTPIEALTGADAAIVVTEWPELLELPWQQAKQVMRRPVVFDGRNMLDPEQVHAAGFTYLAVGRASRK